MRLVILTGTGPEHRYVTASLAGAFPDDLQAIVLAEPPPHSALRRMRGYWRRYSARQLLSRVWAKTYARLTRRAARRDATLSRMLFADGDTRAVPRPDLVRVVQSYNGEACLALLRELAPDIIAVYGTSVIKAPVIQLARRAILNMHTGISPRYRGSDTVFWPLYNSEPEWIGVTVHLLDAGLDSGNIVAAGRPTIEVSDDEDTLFAKCVIEGAKLYVGAVQAAAAGTLRSEPQQLAEGREYRFVDRTVAAERRVDALLRGGLLQRHVGRAR
jgi:folate-dependent phosphoribosylglycinamide formyltransferase PurN